MEIRKNINLENLHEHGVEFDSSDFTYLFKDEEGNFPSTEHKDQIVILNKEAANFLWNFESAVNAGPNGSCPDLDKHFSHVTEIDINESADLKKWLYNCGVAFDRHVYIALQPDMGFVLTWKMIIKYSHKLFFVFDLTVWDRSLNWLLTYHHDGKIHFAQNRITPFL